MAYKIRVDDGGGSDCPHVPPLGSRSDDEVLPVQELSRAGGHSGGDETPVSVQLSIEHFCRAKKRVSVLSCKVDIPCTGNRMKINAGLHH
jgi:hypothetical protein